jgi:hypothetical protein
VSKEKKKKNQQDATIRCLLLTAISTCFGHHYTHLQENKEPVTALCSYCLTEQQGGILPQTVTNEV